MRKIGTGIPGLDEVLEGGLLEGHHLLVEGAPGTGKTTFGLQFAYEGLRQFQEPGIIITFEQFPEQLYRDAWNFGWDLRRMEEADRLRVICTSPQVLHEEIAQPGGLIEATVKEIGAKRIVVDSITHFQRITENRVRLRELLGAFLNGLKRLRLTALLVKELDEISGVSVGFESYMVDALIRLSYIMEPGSSRRVRYLEVLKTRGQDHRPGRHTFRFGPRGIEVFPAPPLPTGEIVGNPHVRVPTGVKGLDKMLNGGLVGGFCTVVAGASGTGKTTLGLQFLYEGVRRDEPSLFVSLEERLYKIFKAAEGYGFLRDMIRKECFRVLALPAAGTDPNELYALIRSSIEEMQVRRVVIDGLTDLKAMIPDSSRLREYLYALLTLFEQWGITSLITHETQEALGGEEVLEPTLSMLIDGIIYLRCREVDGLQRRSLAVLKMRTSSHDMQVREFVISRYGIHIPELEEDSPGEGA